MKEQGDRRRQDVEFWNLFSRLDRQEKQIVRANVLWRLYRRVWKFVEPLIIGEQKRKDE